MAAGFIVKDGVLEYYTDESTPIELTSKACENGDMNKCVELGILHYTGKGVKENHIKATELFTLACKNEHSKGCYHLGSIYKRGANGIEKSLKKSKVFYKLGCMHGYAQSCDQYRLIKEKPETTGKDIDNNMYRYNTDAMWN